MKYNGEFKKKERVKYVAADAEDWSVNNGTVVEYFKRYIVIVRWDDGSEGPCPEMKLDHLKESKRRSRK